MQSIPDNTLAHYAKLPQCNLINLSEVNCQVFAENIREYKKKALMVKPETEALEFYLLNHLVSIIKRDFTRNEILPEWACNVMREYKKVVTSQGTRLTSYIALICVRESRHLSTKSEFWWKQHILDHYGEKNKKFHELIKGRHSLDAVDKFEEKAPSLPIGKFFGAIETIFFNGGFSHSFGGKPWGEITNCLNQFLRGEITQEMLVDTAYTLAHNGGPIFNKGMLYHNYSAKLLLLLDIQRSGQIPELCLDKKELESLGQGLRPTLAPIFEDFIKKSGHKFGACVDWQVVKDAGAVTDCAPKLIAKKVPKPPKVSFTFPTPEGSSIPKPSTIGDKAVKNTGKLFYVGNDEALYILERV